MKRRETLLLGTAALAGLGLPGFAGAATTVQEKAVPSFAVDDATGKRRTLE